MYEKILPSLICSLAPLKIQSGYGPGSFTYLQLVKFFPISHTQVHEYDEFSKNNNLNWSGNKIILTATH